MTEQCLIECLADLEGKAHICGRVWNATVSRLYRRELQDVTDATGREAVRRCVEMARYMPDLPELRDMLRSLTAKGAARPFWEEPRPDQTHAKASRRAGMIAGWQALHPGQELPPEIQKLLGDIEGIGRPMP